jgi:2-enoate reductase
MMPMGVFSPRMANHKDGSYTKDGADYYIERAKGGTGMIVTGVIPIIGHALNPANSPETYTENMKYLADGVHRYGSRLVAQFTALTGRSGTKGNEPAPSEMPNVWDPTKKNPELSRDEIAVYVGNFAAAALAAKNAGVDAVEIHAVHEGYLLDQFAIANMNHRTDEYGGPLENRLRFAAEIVQAIKVECGGDFPVLLRYSVKSYMKGFNRGALPGEDFVEFGRDIEESKAAARILRNAGYDALDCDNGTYDSWYWPHPPMYMPKACNLKDVREIKKAVDIPVIMAGKFDDPGLAEELIGKGEIDMMGMGRPLLADPYAARKFEKGETDDVVPCIGCHMGCLGRIFQGLDISCAVNPRCGREKAYELTEADEKKKILVIGGGLSGMEAARVCAVRGHDVHLYEKTGELGGVFIAASSFDFKDDDRRLLAWYRKQMKDLGVHLRMNAEATAEIAKAGNFDEIFVATGATERHISVPGVSDGQMTYAVETLLGGEVLEDDVLDALVIGGGLTGCEIAYSLAKKGKKVTIIEMTETILNAFGLSAANYNMLMELLEFYKVNIITNAVVESVQGNTATIVETIKNYPNIHNRAKRIFAVGPKGMPVKREIKADRIVASVGYISNRGLYETLKGDHTRLLGDASNPSNVMEAIWSAYEAALRV